MNYSFYAYEYFSISCPFYEFFYSMFCPIPLFRQFFFTKSLHQVNTLIRIQVKLKKLDQRLKTVTQLSQPILIEIQSQFQLRTNIC